MSVSPPRAIGQLLNTGRYPLSDPSGAAWRDVVAGARGELARLGCCVLHDFIRPDLVDALADEGTRIAPLAHYETERVNAYNTALDAPLPDDHPARITMDRGNAFVSRDRIPAEFVIQQLYADPLFQRFIADCFGLAEAHMLADPLSGLCLNVVSPGMEHPWHFDINEFTVSLLTREPEAGGVFEYCPNIRSAEAENFDAVRDVLVGAGERHVRRLALGPGDLQLFRGRYSLHRVTAVRGRTARHSAIFAYSERPGVVGGVTRTRQLFGRVLPQHVAEAHRAVRVDRLLD